MLRAILFRIRSLLQRPRVARELDAELQFHLAMETEKRIAQGTTPAEAGRQAVAAFGGLAQTKEAVRDVRATLLDSLGQDVRFALRAFRRSPGFTAVAIVTLALGIGANTAIFTLIDAILFRPLPYGDPGRLVWIMGYDARSGEVASTIAGDAYAEIVKHHRGLEAVSCSSWTGPVFTSVDDERTSLRSFQVCANLPDSLQVRPLLGRTFRREEGAEDSGVAILTFRAWQKYFRGDAAVVGRTVNYKEGALRIVGVMRPEFVAAPALFFGQPDLLIPAEPPSGREVAVAVARLRRGVSVAQAQAELEALDTGMQAAAGTRSRTPRMKLVPLQEGIFRGIRPLSMVLFAAAVLVLLLAIVNLANLLLARGSWREHELAIRAALGAGRGRLVRQLVVEGLLLSMTGGAIGVGLAAWTFTILHARVPSRLFSAFPSGVDRRVLAFACVISLLAGIAAALLPALRVTGRRLAWALNDGRRPGRTMPAGRRARGTVLVVAQMALVVVILTAAGLMLNSLVRALTVDLGVRAENVVSMRSAPPRSAWQRPAAAAAYYRDLAARVASVPGVKRVAGVCTLTLGGRYGAWDRMLRERPPAIEGARYLVTADYFSVLGIRVIAGRAFTRSEIDGVAPVAIVNETAARRLWPGESPLHKQFRTGDEPPREVIGVVADTRDSYHLPVRPALYVPPDWSGRRPLRLDLVAEVEGDAGAAATAIRARLETAAFPGAVTVETLQEAVRDTTVGERFQTLLLALFAALALLLAAVGIAGIVGYTVARRTREIGVRIALGSTRSRVAALVIRQSLALVASGAAIGVAGALAVTRVLRGLLFQVKPNDPATFAAAVAALLLTAAVASLLPALRAARVDPVVVLKTE